MVDSAEWLAEIWTPPKRKLCWRTIKYIFNFKVCLFSRSDTLYRWGKWLYIPSLRLLSGKNENVKTYRNDCLRLSIIIYSCKWWNGKGNARYEWMIEQLLIYIQINSKERSKVQRDDGIIWHSFHSYIFRFMNIGSASFFLPHFNLRWWEKGKIFEIN